MTVSMRIHKVVHLYDQRTCFSDMAEVLLVSDGMAYRSHTERLESQSKNIRSRVTLVV